MKPLIEDFDKVLVVEGYSDLRFYAEILEYVGLGNQVFIQEITNRAGLTVSLETLLKPDILATKRMIGVIVDADNAPSRNAQRLEASLTQICGQTVSTGQWSSKTPRIGLWLAPGGGVAGEIETLVWRSWSNDPANSQTKLCVENYIACMRSAGVVARSPDKGLVSTVLAVRNDEDPRLGPGAQARVFDFSRPEYSDLCQFLKGFA